MIVLPGPQRSRREALLLGAAALVAASGAGVARAAAPLKVATLKFGTVNWLLDTVKAEGLDVREGAAFERTDLASTQALTVALQAGDVDFAVSDWPWAMRRRIDGEPFRFAPYSSALGAVMVGKDSVIASISDLKGKKLGVAGGPLDKSWLLFRAYAHKEVDGDIAAMVEPVFGAPPLLSEQLRLGRVDAVLTFWNFAARLDAQGYRRLIDISEVMSQLGLKPPPPLVGFVWRETLEQKSGAQVDAFFRAIAAANQVLKTSDAAWERLKPSMQVASDAEFMRLRDYFRAGVPGPWGEAELASSKKLYDLLADLGGPEFVGANPHFEPSLFWSPKA
ncbi:ABC transporter substrate-binding protein [Hansschlegelia plantiphila]|uniref:ABC transporter substrate-binding protein n=1 Tax=Hansschlegelia plantiphila TaxID=374655 RepID=A0A9W6J4D5_9HYPH|nr:ABC transporter substrate-binding protein [Hansschlegelia plantiphila]GLK69139.1 ABC transporter substrate-binding protein [Hansschlegelia plantiphila]